MIRFSNARIEENGVNTLLKINLSFFADESTGERTEQATPKKKEKAREEGQVAISPEVATAFIYIVMFNCLRSFSLSMYNKMINVFLTSFNILEDYKSVQDLSYAVKLIGYMFTQSILIALPLLLISMIIGVITSVLQVGWHPTSKPLRPKFSKLNPISGVKRLFSPKAIVDLIKSLLKMGIIGLVIYNILQNRIKDIPGLVNLTLMESVLYIGDLMITLGTTVGMWFIFVALLDFSYQRFKHNKDLKMSKYEIKQEYKQSEGDPQIKGKIKQRMLEASQRRMMKSIPSADVIITNPTHYAVAIKYEKEGVGAPQVVAKGVDFLAKRIKELAIENSIEIVENKQLARTLYATVDIGKEIPPELYQAVAEILAFVYKLKNKI